MTRVVLVGAGGWLGSAVRSALEADGPVTTLSRQAMDGLTAHDLAVLLRPGPDLVLVNAGGRLRGTPAELARDNLDLPTRLVDALAGTGAYLLHLGSPAEYGDPGSADPIPEAHVLEPTTEYGRVKAAASRAVLEHRGWCVLRPFNVIDRDMIEANPIAIIREQVRAAAQDGHPIELPAAEAVRDHPSRAFVAASVARAARDRIPGAFNLCSGLGLSYRSITQAIARRLGVPVSITDLDNPGIRAVVGDPAAWRARTGMAVALDADDVAALVLGQPIGSLG